MRYAATIFLSAFLLFVVELVIGKFILPWFGGTPAVWTTCMLFFQVLLLAGYAYAHAADLWLSPTAQSRLHGLLLFASVGLMGFLALRWGSPILASAEWRPRTPEWPVLQVLRLLAVSVGLPFFALSATSPLLQRWHSRERGAPFPYRLYALSNVGSLLGLLSYPFLIEPRLALPRQAAAWAVLYAAFAALCAGCAVRFAAAARAATAPEAETEAGAGGRPGWGKVLLWVLLSAVGSAMLLAVTNRMCQEIAVVPFLWVLPLVLYLVTFVVAFDSPRWYSRELCVALCALVTLAVPVAVRYGVHARAWPSVLLHGALLFLFCMTCHGELVRSRPSPRHLTAFYLAMAFGAALGGAFVALLAPLIFAGYWEFETTVVAAWFLFTVVLARDRASAFHTGNRWLALLAMLAVVFSVLRYVFDALGLSRMPNLRDQLPLIQVLVSVAAAELAAVLFWQKPFMGWKLWPRVLMAAMILSAGRSEWAEILRARLSAVGRTRNFYGAMFVAAQREPSSGQLCIRLAHGRTNHGLQYTEPELRGRPTSYYGPATGAALAIEKHPRRGDRAGLRIGVVGLGVGTLAAYAGTNDTIRFYEVNPAVARWATGPDALFSYLDQCRGNVEVVMGDARLSMEREWTESGSQRYDVLVLDAFSSDAIPVHLLTREAFSLYSGHLRDSDSIIAVHISNRSIDLWPLLFTVAREFGLKAGVFVNADAPPLSMSSTWVLMTHGRDFMTQEDVRRRRYATRPSRCVLWTDNFSNLLTLLR